jgi:hypothetical protein
VHPLHSRIIAPNNFIEPSLICDRQHDGLPACPTGTTLGYWPSQLPDVFDSQMKPILQQLLLNPGSLNYFEPKRTFRFTVSRTF